MHACIEEGPGNPLQYSCLENPRDRGAWWAAVYGVTQSQTRLKRLSCSSSSRCRKMDMETIQGPFQQSRDDRHSGDFFTFCDFGILQSIILCLCWAFVNHLFYLKALEYSGQTFWARTSLSVTSLENRLLYHCLWKTIVLRFQVGERPVQQTGKRPLSSDLLQSFLMRTVFLLGVRADALARRPLFC